MGASASVDQGRPTGAHERDIASSGSEKQHDWSQSEQAEGKPETHSLQEELESYVTLVLPYCPTSVSNSLYFLMLFWQINDDISSYSS